MAADFLSADEEKQLIGHLSEEGLSPIRFQQWTGKRLTCSYGGNYDFENAAFARTDPMPVWLETVRGRAAHFAGLKPADLVQALLIRLTIKRAEPSRSAADPEQTQRLSI